jgi:hypothetical protein
MKGQVAKDLTAAEFREIIEDLKAVLDERSNRKKLKPTQHWILSIDNDSRHHAARLHTHGVWLNQDRLDLPPLSPDMNKVVEHVHAWLTKKMHAWLRSRAADKPTPRQCMMQCKEFFSQYPRASIQADVDSMQATYAAIQQQAGMYPAAKFR